MSGVAAFVQWWRAKALFAKSFIGTRPDQPVLSHTFNSRETDGTIYLGRLFDDKITTNVEWTFGDLDSYTASGPATLSTKLASQAIINSRFSQDLNFLSFRHTSETAVYVAQTMRLQPFALRQPAPRR